MRARLILLLGFLSLLIVLTSTSTPRRVGDGAEYMAMAASLSQFQPPSFSADSIAYLREKFPSLEDEFSYVERQHLLEGTDGQLLREHYLQGSDGRYDLFHFWFYSGLAAPWFLILSAMGVHLNYSFTLLNAGLFLLALWLVSSRLHWSICSFLFGSPILWWIDKAHTEVFTFSLLAIALSQIRGRPWWSFVCMGIAATQNPPFGAMIPIVLIVALSIAPKLWRDGRLWIGLIASCFLTLLHPLYYYLRLGMLSPLMNGPMDDASKGFSKLYPEALGAVIWDPNIGMLVNFPFFLPILLITGIILFRKAPRRLLSPPLLAGIAMGALFIVSIAQADNVNHGGTPGMSRYALWLIPLAIPLFTEAQEAFGAALRSWIIPFACISCLLCVIAFHPMKPLNLNPTPVAAWLWENHPSLHNPLPEIFIERVLRSEVKILPIANESCSKVLLIAGRWPMECPPQGTVPLICHPEGRLCYANRTGSGYRFVRAPGRDNDLLFEVLPETLESNSALKN